MRLALAGALLLVLVAQAPGDGVRAVRRGMRAAPRRDEVTVAFAGDVSLARGVERAASRDGWSAQVRGLGDSLARADFAIANLESPLGQCLGGGDVAYPRLCGSAEGIAALSELGVDAVTLANNHALDSDREGLRLTAERLSARGIVALGVRAAEQGTLRAERLGPIAVVAANATRTRYEPGRSVPLATPRAIERAVREARRSEARRPVIVSIHAGREGWRWASRHDGELARAAVAGGAAAVVFHGAHVVRELRVERGVPVHLGLGNLLFDQRAPAMREGVVLTLRVPLRGGPAAVEGVTRVRAARDHE